GGGAGGRPAAPRRGLLPPGAPNRPPRVPPTGLARQLDVPELKLGRSVIKTHRDEAESLVNAAEQEAARQREQWLQQARQDWERLEGGELQRLLALQAVNPSVRDSEVAAQRRRVAEGLAALERLQMSLHAVRFIIAA
ncbi:MAG: hypothetical protein VW625_08660, partial [Perlucidibaca sp.]